MPTYYRLTRSCYSLFLLLAFLFAASSTYAQMEIEWERNLGGTSNDEVIGITQTDNGSYIVALGSGSTTLDANGNYGSWDYLIMGLDSSGNTLWSNQYGGTGADQPMQVEPLSDGSMIIAGRSTSIDLDVGFNYGTYDGWLMRADTAGNILWDTIMGTGDWDFLEHLVPAGNGQYWCIGMVGGSTGGSTGWGNRDGWIFKFDTTGTIVWENHYGGSDYDRLHGATATPDGGLVAVGYSRSSDNHLSSNNGYDDVWVLRIDSLGDTLWSVNYGGTQQDYGQSVVCTNDGGFLVSGSTSSNNFDVSGNHGGEDYWVLKLDSLGSLQWQKTYGGSQGDAMVRESIEITPQGTFMIGGMSESNNGDVSSNNGNNDFWLIEIDGSGNLLWEGNYGGSSSEWYSELITTADSCLLMGGSSPSDDFDVGANYGQADGWLVKLRPCPAPDTSFTTAAICAGDSLQIGSAWHHTAGTYYDTLQLNSGCDSIVAIALMVIPAALGSDTITACNSYAVFGNTHTQSGTYIDTLAGGSAAGCDTIFTTVLTVLNSPVVTDSISICLGDTLQWNGNPYSAIGSYTDTLMAANGCDSFRVLVLSYYPVASSNIQSSICPGDSVLFGSIWHSIPGVYHDTLPGASAMGCDSMVALTLTNTPPSTSSLNALACPGDSVLFGGLYYSLPGTYYDTVLLGASNGCDSIAALVLSSGITDTLLTITACEEYNFNGTQLLSSGVYLDTLTNAIGCDSLIVLNLTVNPATAGTITATTCGSFNFNGTFLTASGNYTDTLTGSLGCDSIVALSLTVIEESDTVLAVTACDSHWFAGGLLTSSGSYSDTLVNSGGCDSIVTLNLTIVQSTAAQLSDTACGPYDFLGQELTATGTYTDTIPNAAGCDSIITLSFVRIEHNTQVFDLETSLVAVEANLSFQWLDCVNAYAPLDGETMQSLVPAQNGSYAVELSDAVCADTSDCYTVVGIGIENSLAPPSMTLHAAPNPTNSSVALTATGLAGTGHVEVYNPLGTLVHSGWILGNQPMALELSGAAGLYLVRVLDTSGQQQTLRVLKTE